METRNPVEACERKYYQISAAGPVETSSMLFS